MTRIRLIFLSICFLAFGAVLAQEPTTFTIEVRNVSNRAIFDNTGVFGATTDTDTLAPLQPGETMEFEFPAFMADRLNFAFMLVESNDLFFALDGEGLMLYDENGDPPSGDITDQIYLWDLGTEVNEPIGTGDNQAPRQTANNTGIDEFGTAQLVSDLDDDLAYPAVSDIVRITIEQQDPSGMGDGDFKVWIENISDTSDFPTALSPGIWVLHFEPSPFFTVGERDYGDGFEALAEDVDPSILEGVYTGSDIQTSITPIVYTVHSDTAPFFTAGLKIPDNGLEALAEDGDAAVLGANFAIAENDGAALPGESYVFTIEAIPGDSLSLVTMFAESNDLFFAPDEKGIPLFDADGNPLSGDVTSYILLWDAGTEVNEAPAEGANQAPRQAAPNTGDDENGIVQLVDDGFTYPVAPSVIRVIITVED